MNLPTISSNFQVFSRKQTPRRDFRTSWGAKTPGIQAGHYIDGIILGFELNEFRKKNIILKSLTHNGAQVLVWSCSSLNRELHADEETCQQLLFFPGDVVRITYKGSYEGKKGISAGKMIAVFDIDELVGYTKTPQDTQEVFEFQQAQQIKASQQYQPMPTYSQPVPNLQQPPKTVYAQQQPQQLYALYTQPQQPMTNEYQQSNSTITTSLDLKSGVVGIAQQQAGQPINYTQLQQQYSTYHEAPVIKKEDDNSFDI